MTSEAFLTIVGAVITVIAVLISVYIIPLVKSVVSEKDMQVILNIVKIAVLSADQIYTREEFAEKKAYVMKYIIDFVDEHFNVRLTEDEIDALVEGQVNLLHENGVR